MRNIKKSIIFYIFILLLFLVDLFLYFFFYHQYLYTLLCLLSIFIFCPIQLTPVCFIAILLSLESFMQYNWFGISLLYIIPLGIFSVKTKQLLHRSRIYMYILLILFLCIQCFIIEHSLFGIEHNMRYTITKIIANIILTWFLSLKFYTLR